MSEATKPRLPEVGEYVRMHGKLVGIEDVTPKVVIIDYIFEDTEATIYARVNGKVIKEYSTYNNFYGQDTCVTNAIADAQKLTKEFEGSNVELVVVKTTRQVRKRPEDGCLANFYDSEFVNMHSLRSGGRWNLPDEKREEVWSSQRGSLVPEDSAK